MIVLNSPECAGENSNVPFLTVTYFSSELLGRCAGQADSDSSTQGASRSSYHLFLKIFSYGRVVFTVVLDTN